VSDTGKEKERRPYLASECLELPKAEKWRMQIIREIAKKVAQIQNGRLSRILYVIIVAVAGKWSGNSEQCEFCAIQTNPKAHPASCTKGTGSFPGLKWPMRGVDHSPPNTKL
jgi:hypothetical protein